MTKRHWTCKEIITQRSLNWGTIDPLERLPKAEERQLVAAVAELLVDAVELERSAKTIEEESDE